MRVTLTTLVAATLLTLCVGLQVLEATGRWERTFQDAGDEAIIVTVVLCIGAAFAAARAGHHRVSPIPLTSAIALFRAAAVTPVVPAAAPPAVTASPPASLRI